MHNCDFLGTSFVYVLSCHDISEEQEEACALEVTGFFTFLHGFSKMHRFDFQGDFNPNAILNRLFFAWC